MRKPSDIALKVLERQYLLRDADGNLKETPEELYLRVADAIAAESRKFGLNDLAVGNLANEFFAVMSEGAFLPNSPTLMNAGTDVPNLSACFVMDGPGDSIESIYDTLKRAALVHRVGGGTGKFFGDLRPEGSTVRSTTGVASGPVSFLRLFDASTQAIKAGGKRRGANMAILNVDHPDIEKFVTCKSDTSQITGFNISVSVTDDWMQKVKDGDSEANRLMNLIAKEACATGEPGIWFYDRNNESNPVPNVIPELRCCNPCAEQALGPNDSCNLASINLGYFVRDGQMDWRGLRRTIHLGVTFLDNVIEAGRYPFPEMKDLAQRIRRIGLGPMGVADALAKMRIPYDSDEAIATVDGMAEFFQREAHAASEQLAVTRGTFPEWPRSVWGLDSTCSRDAHGLRMRPPRLLRNAHVTTAAPTGTISILASCSGGIEPLFARSFVRRQAGHEMLDVNPLYAEAAMELGREKAKNIFRTALEIAPEWHVRHLCAWQKHLDNGASKTINLPKGSSPDDVKRMYLMAWEGGAKAVSVYVTGSRPQQVLTPKD